MMREVSLEAKPNINVCDSTVVTIKSYDMLKNCFTTCNANGATVLLARSVLCTLYETLIM